MAYELTQDACALLQSATPPEGFEPIMQVLSVKRVNVGSTTAGQPDRMRLILSDGAYFTQAMLATQLNAKFESGELDKHVVIRVDKFVCNLLQNKRLVIVLDLTILGTAEEKIGSPESIDNIRADAIINGNTGGGSSTTGSSTTVRPNGTNGTTSAARSGTSTRTPNGATLFPIEGLSPYQNKWTIKARITQKSDIKHWSNQRGEGKLFSVTMMDESGEIRGTAFNQQVDELYERLQEGKVYFISKARVGLAKKQFSNLANEYEITFERNTEVEPCMDATDVPEVKYNFVDLQTLQDLNKDATCDVIGVVTEVGPMGEIVSKATQRSVAKRELTIVDRSGFSCRLTLWGRSGESYQAEDQPVIAFKGVRVGDFGGRSLSFQSSSTMSINPDIPEAHQLRGWFDSAGQGTQFRTHAGAGGAMTSGGSTFNRTELKTLAAVKDENLGMGEKNDYFASRATVVHVKQDNLSYPACRGEKCNKKVVEGQNGKWECANCNLSYDEPEYRYLVNISVADHTGQAWFSAFNEVGEVLFGQTAGELQALKNEDETLFSAAVTKALSKIYNFSCRARQDNFNDQTRVRYSVSRMHPLDYKVEARALVDNIRSYY